MDPSLIDTNFNRHVSFVASIIDAMRVDERPGFTAVDSGLPCDTFNIVHITNGSIVTEEALAISIRRYQDRNLPYCIWINENNLSDRLRMVFAALGIREKDSGPGMVLDLGDYSPIYSPLHDRIVVASSAGQVADYAHVIARNWSPPDPEVERYYQMAASHILAHRDTIQLAIAYEPPKSGGNETREPHGVVEIFASDSETAGIYGLATPQMYRGKGIGSALMTFCLNSLKERGFRKVILQASQDGINIYRRLGFEVHARYFEFG